MKKGLKVTLLAGALGFAIAPSAFAAAPVISGLPDITVGDVSLEDPSGSNNVFVFSNAFSFSDYVSDSDTPDANLIWSFGEYDSDFGLATPQYNINGKGPVNAGDAAIAADEANGHANAKAPGANQINSDSDFATFRDILFSPSGDGPFGNPDPDDAADAAQGKGVRLYVSDGTDVDYQDIFVHTVDGSNDVLTESAGFQEEFIDTNFASGWQKSGVDSGPEWFFDTTSPDDVDVTSATAGQLDVIVRPSTGRYRILGWLNPNIIGYDEVGASKFLRGKFYIYTSNAANAPVNEVPNFQIRLQNEGAVVNNMNISHSQTGSGGTPHEPAYSSFNNAAAELVTGDALRPSSLSTSPSLYKVDFDPVDVPAAAGTGIWAAFESFSTANTANATLSLTEVVVGTYDALDPNEGTSLFIYDKAVGAANSSVPGGAKNFSGGGFNYEADFQAGRRQALFFNGDGKGTTSATVASRSEGIAQGILVDTLNTPANMFGAGIFNLVSTNNADRARVEAGKMYMARYFVTSDVPTTSNDSNAVIQGSVNLSLQTGGGAYVSTLAITGSQNASSPANNTKAVATQALPGIGSENQATSAALEVLGEEGGWYTVLLPSPLDAGAIRADDEDFGAFASEPGPGDSAASARDIVFGGVVLESPDQLRFSPTFVAPNAQPNRGKIRVGYVELLEYPALEDLGY